MRSNTQHRPVSQAEEMGLGPKKTALVLFTVVGCIAILFPKIFYPMIVGPPKEPMRGPPNLQKQERPPHMRDIVHPGMQERGRAIPPHPSVPILERPGKPGGFPGNIERRPGGPMVPGQPGPSQRAAAFQAQQKPQTASQSIIMPIYTFGIVAFFVFTIVKMLLRKTGKLEAPNIKALPKESDPKFAEKVFGRKNSKEEAAKKKLVYTAIQGIIEATNDQLSEIERDCAVRNKDEHDVHKTDTDKPDAAESRVNGDEKEIKLEDVEKESAEKRESSHEDLLNHNGSDSGKLSTEQSTKSEEKTEHDLEIEKRLNSLRESMHIRAVENFDNSDLKSIYLEGEFPLDPQILVSATETETKTEKISHYPSVKDVADDEAVILSGKMTISLISLANNHNHEEEEKNGIAEDHTTATTNNVA